MTDNYLIGFKQSHSPYNNSSVSNDNIYNIYMNLPYLGSINFGIERKLISLIRNRYSTVNLEMAFITSLSTVTLFRFKDDIPKPLQPSTIYKHSCCSCYVTYNRKTFG